VDAQERFVLCLTTPVGRATARTAGTAATARAAAPTHARHVPERTLLYALVQAHYPDFLARLEAEDRSLPAYVREEFDAYLRCGVLDHGFLRVVCEHCHAERLVAFSCKKCGFCPSCGARHMAESARHLVNEVFGPRPVRQWVLSFPHPLCFLFASKPDAIGPVLAIVHRVIAGWRLGSQRQYCCAPFLLVGSPPWANAVSGSGQREDPEQEGREDPAEPRSRLVAKPNDSAVVKPPHHPGGRCPLNPTFHAPAALHTSSRRQLPRNGTPWMIPRHPRRRTSGWAPRSFIGHTS
jgi:hypothetical protein